MNISKNLKSKIFSKEVATSLTITVLVFILDRVTKTAIVNHQTNNDSIIVNDYLNFDLIWNTGISFGLFSHNANIYYHLISLLIFLVIIYLIFLAVQAKYLVNDFHWFTFNIADIFITLGVILIIVSELTLKKK